MPKRFVRGELGVEELGVKAIDDKTLEITLETLHHIYQNYCGSRFLPQSVTEKEDMDLLPGSIGEWTF